MSKLIPFSQYFTFLRILKLYCTYLKFLEEFLQNFKIRFMYLLKREKEREEKYVDMLSNKTKVHKWPWMMQM